MIKLIAANGGVISIGSLDDPPVIVPLLGNLLPVPPSIPPPVNVSGALVVALVTA